MHATLAQVIIAAVGVSLGTGLGFVLAGIFRGADSCLRQTLAARDLTIESQARRIGLVQAENVRLRPLAELGQRTLDQRKRALDAANAANARRASERAAA